MSLCCTEKAYAQQLHVLRGQVLDQVDRTIEDVIIYIPQLDKTLFTNQNGYFEVQLVADFTYEIIFEGLNIISDTVKVTLSEDISRTFRISTVLNNLSEVIVRSDEDAFGIRRLRSLESGGLYEGKKTDVINIDRLIANKAANNARQAFSKIPSLNIWESDNAGLQLDIGGRGLSPKRTQNFNTRQNGYDISADALGYPESYYTPPLQAVEQIEIVRGAGALQYGTQFGGLVNFKMKRGETDRSIRFDTQNTYGAYNFFNTFNELQGQVGKLNYYGFLQYKRGDGWRDNSEFEQYTSFISLQYAFSKRIKAQFDYTHMYYLSRQAGGHTDESFAINPQGSNRERNWFKVNWNLAALRLEYVLNENITIYNRLFALQAGRTSLGLLETPDIADPLSNRDLIDGQFSNVGNETRLAWRYGDQKDRKHALLLGTRLYKGTTNFSQGFGSVGADADFTKVDTAFLDRRTSDFNFPNFNVAFFAENIFRVSDKTSLIPGIRYEYINTESNGFFTSTIRINSFGDFIEQVTQDTSANQRHIFLYGLGVSHKMSDRYELYGNATANYRAINFTDIQIQTNTQVVDSLIRDESGYSFDIGIRKRDYSPFFIEGGLFFILYNDRIGEVIDDGLRLRTNIGSAAIYGLELYFESDILALLGKETPHRLSWFINGSINRGQYTDINNRALVGVRSGNRIEELPDYNIKSGLSYGYDKLNMTLQASFIGRQFSDAANTVDPFVGVFGEIPSYTVFDYSAKYTFSDRLSVSASINNLTDVSYFTRRATAYPGPGIIPALGRTWNVTVHATF